MTSMSTSITAPAMASSENANDKEINKTSSSLLFGSLNESIADAVYHSLGRHLLPRLQALPVLGERTGAPQQPTQLQERILQKYLPAADLVELYGQRNVFSLQRIEPPSRRQRILDLLEQCHDIESASALEESFLKSDWMDTSKSIPDESILVDSATTLRKGDIPSQQDIQSAEQDLHSLNLQLQQLKQQRETLSKDLTVLKSLNENHRYHAVVSKDVMMQDIPKQVRQQISVAQALRECQNDSAALQQRMESMQRERSSAVEHSMDAIVMPPKTVTTQHPPAASLLERYEQDFQQLGGAISARSLASLSERLKK
jgi:chromosome segregation ATPase